MMIPYTDLLLNKESIPPPSKKTLGAIKGSMLDDNANQVSGQAEFVRVERSAELTPLQKEIIDVLVHPLVDKAIDRLVYHTEIFIENIVIPAGKQAVIKVKKWHKSKTEANNKVVRQERTRQTCDECQPAPSEKHDTEPDCAIIFPAISANNNAHRAS